MCNEIITIRHKRIFYCNGVSQKRRIITPVKDEKGRQRNLLLQL